MSIRNGIVAFMEAMEKDFPDGDSAFGKVSTGIYYVWMAPLVTVGVVAHTAYVFQSRAIRAVANGWARWRSSEEAMANRRVFWDHMQDLPDEQQKDIDAWLKVTPAISFIWGATTAVVIGGVLWVLT